MKNVIIDTDPGVDDALALLLALRSPELNVLGITTVAGNLVLGTTTRNALIIIEHSDRQVPVYAGAALPLIQELETAERAHGKDGLGDLGFSGPTSKPETENAVDFIRRTVLGSSTPIHLITLGPLTNVALALTTDRHIESHIASLTMMLGAWGTGNITQVAEFNAGVDPEASDIVFRSAIPRTMVALDPIRSSAHILPEDVERLHSAGTPWGMMAAALLRPWLRDEPSSFVSLCDPAAVAVAIDPSVAMIEKLPVRIETRGEHTRGMTVVDFRRGRGHTLGVHEPNTDVVLSFHVERFRSLVMNTYLGSEERH